MSKKTAELDILGETHLPADLFTPTLGSNYGLDGFPDMEYGMGVLEGVAVPELMETPALPTGLSKAGTVDGDGMNLTAYMEDSLADLSWLDPTQLPDLDRLPERPVSIPELEEAWGVNRRTNGVQVFAQDLGTARYEASLENDTSSKKANQGSLLKVVRRAMQRSAMEHDIEAVLNEASLHLGEEAPRLARVIEEIRADHGLAGNVFVRASAYPGYGEGKWRDHFKRYARAARYVVVSPKELKTATWIQDGRCSLTGKTAVVEVPWSKARAYYAPRLAAARGVKVASGDARSTLREAFLTAPEKRVVETVLPQHDPTSREAFLAEPVEHKVYDGQDTRVAKGVSRVAAAIEKGSYGGALKSLIRSSFLAKDMKAAVKQLAPLLRESGALERKGKATASYQGHEYSAHSMARAASIAEAPVLSKIASGALRWALRTMSEGYAGGDLDYLIHHRLGNDVLAQIEEPLREARAAHEGGAGFMYVDASAYATSSGIKGCEEGALKHRANTIPAVAAMDRCASCTLVRTLENGTRKCAVYNKALLDDTSGNELASMRKANIRVANMDDAQQTAAFFTSPENAYSEEDYSLRNANLDDVAPDMPEHEKMAAITFGGWDL